MLIDRSLIDYNSWKIFVDLNSPTCYLVTISNFIVSRHELRVGDKVLQVKLSSVE